MSSRPFGRRARPGQAALDRRSPGARKRGGGQGGDESAASATSSLGFRTTVLEENPSFSWWSEKDVSSQFSAALALGNSTRKILPSASWEVGLCPPRKWPRPWHVKFSPNQLGGLTHPARCIIQILAILTSSMA